MGRAGITPPKSLSGTVALQYGMGLPMVMLQFPAWVLEMEPIGTRMMDRDTAGAQKGGGRVVMEPPPGVVVVPGVEVEEGSMEE